MKREFLSPSEGYEKGGINKYQTCRRRRRRKRRRIQRHGTWFIIQVSTMAVVYMLLGSITIERERRVEIKVSRCFVLLVYQERKRLKRKKNKSRRKARPRNGRRHRWVTQAVMGYHSRLVRSQEHKHNFQHNIIHGNERTKKESCHQHLRPCLREALTKAGHRADYARNKDCAAATTVVV